MNSYRQRTLALMARLLQGQAPIPSALDFGCGDGWIAREVRSKGLVQDVTPIDVVRRPQCFVEPVIYGGDELPFADCSFDLVYAVDVLHHCQSPLLALQDLARCGRQWLLLKDHTYHSPLGKLTLGVLDEIGNRRFGIPSPYHYQQDWHWFSHLEALGFVKEALIHPAPCHRGVLGTMTNSLQFVGLWRRAS